MFNRITQGRLVALTLLAGLVGLGAACIAQTDLLRFDAMDHHDASGVRDGGDGPLHNEFGQVNRSNLYSTIVHSPGANLLRVHFGEFNLGQHSQIRITSLKDGSVQRFDQRSLEDWQGWSAIFNGEVLSVQLLVAPGDRASFVIDQISVNAPPLDAADGGIAGANINGLCGSDTRGPSNDPRIGRMSSATCGDGGGCGGCTGWLTSIGAVVTAGHCGGNGGLIEFNVPQSAANGMPVASNPDDQYAMGGTYYAFQNGGVGFDWAVLSVATNSNTGLHPHWVQGYIHLSPVMPGEEATLRITGYGVDNVPTGSNPGLCCNFVDGDCTHFGCNSTSLTLQTATGPLKDSDSNAMFMRVSVQPANSGSPIIRVSNGYAIGVLTHGGCTANSDTVNAGNRLTQSTFSTFLNNFLGPNAVFVDFANVSPTLTGSALNPVRTVPQGITAAPSNGFVNIAGGNYPAAAGNTGIFNKAVTLRAVSGVVTIGN